MSVRDTLNKDIIEQLRQIVGEEYIFTDASVRDDYSHDETENLRFLPELVLKPADTAQVSAIMAVCYMHGIPVTPRGAGTGLAGGALPVNGGVLLSMERFNHILDIDERNLQVITQPAVITEVLQQAVKEKGLFYPPDPASKGTCFIGGNVNTNAGGPKAVKYGVTAAYVLNLEVVLPDGRIIETGANTLKNSTGYNLTQLFVGSEGTLGIVTRITLRLIPHPTHTLVMLAPFRSPAQACAAVSAIFRAGVTPSGLEFMERSAIDKAIDWIGGSSIPVADDTQAHLLIELDGFYPDVLMAEAETIAGVLAAFDCPEPLFADSEEQKQELWRLRRNVAHAVKKTSIYKEEDTVVPRAELPKLLEGIKEIGSRYGFESVCYGHAGDGNLHVNILKGNLSDTFWNEDLILAIREIFTLVKSLGGTISGEHGIGWVQKRYLDIVFSPDEISLQKQLKAVFDPKGIMNPGKVF